jgi:hypothetical protein
MRAIKIKKHYEMFDLYPGCSEQAIMDAYKKLEITVLRFSADHKRYYLPKIKAS